MEDNKSVTMVSTNLGVEAMSACQRYNSDIKKKEDVPCSNVKSYNKNTEGINKSGVLVHLCRTLMKSKRWYIRLFAYIIDLCRINAWLRGCRSLNEAGMPLEEVRVEVFWSAACKKSNILHPH